MRRIGSRVAVATAVVLSVLASAGAQATEGDASLPRQVLSGAASAARALALRVMASADHGARPFAIVDKQAARITVYRADGSVAGTSPVLLGRTSGDEASPGVGERAQSGGLRLADLTTPAGRFTTQPGRNRAGDNVVWLDYGNALAIHRLRPAPAVQQRERRMASADPRDKRISAGCVVVPVAFFDTVVQPVLGRSEAVVYVMPEDSSRWPTLWRDAAAAVPAAMPDAGSSL